MDCIISVGRGGLETRTVPAVAQQVIRWGFDVSDALDIGFSVNLYPEASDPGASTRDPQVVCPHIRLPVEHGAFIPPVSGTLEFTFDNSYSLLRGKSVDFRVVHGAAATITLADLQVDGRISESAIASILNTVKTARIYDSNSMNDLAILGSELFFINQFAAAEAFFEPLAGEVPIFGLGYATMAFLRAFMTWEADIVAVANARLSTAQKVCTRMMPHEGMLGSLFKSGTGETCNSGNGGLTGGMTTLQLEATVVFAETTLLSGLLNLMEESIMGMVRAGLSIRSGWNYYVHCDKALGNAVSNITGGDPLSPTTATTAAITSPQDSDATSLNHHVLGGLEFGMGSFNCVASILPGIVLKIISVLGFPCDRLSGMAQLRRCATHFTIRTPLAGLMLLIMRVILPSFHSGDISDNVPEAEAVLAMNLGRYGDSALFLWMAGRLARMQGDVALARERLLRCAAGPIEWVQLAHLCAYELGWCYAFLHDWENVLPLFARLKEENEWSKAFYAYMQALALLQLGRIAEARLKMRDVIRLSGRRLGGKVISAEQYSVRRAAEFVALTTIDAADAAAAGVHNAVDDAEESSLLGSAASLPRLRLPAVVQRGSKAHACVLAYGAPLAALEKIYLFNGACQMDDIAMRSAIQQIDAIIAVTADGHVFNATSPVWQGTAAAAGFGGAQACSFMDAHREESSPPLTPTPNPDFSRLHQTFTRAASVEVGSLGAPMASSTAGSSRFSFRNVFSSITGSTSSSTASQHASATPLSPVHTIAVAALVRGALCASLGRADEAAVCYQWVIEQGEAGKLKRDMHVYAYALYEHGILYVDALKALNRKAAETAKSGAPHHAHVHVPGIDAALFVQSLNAKQLKEQAKRFMQRAKDIKDDYNWKVRLHMRVHLAMDEMRRKPGRRVTQEGAGAVSEEALLHAASTPIGSAPGHDSDVEYDSEAEAGESATFDGEDLAAATALAAEGSKTS